MPFRASFACLWCGAAHSTRSPDDLEGWAQLCPACVGRAGENNFLRSRLRQALTERGAATAPIMAMPIPTPADASEPTPGPTPTPSIEDDWYLRRGPASQGPIHDAAFLAELDAAGTWLDAIPMRGTIVQLQAGTGWWAPLLAGKGELSLFDASPAALDRARERLLAHGLRAHLHVRDPRLPPDQVADTLLLSRWLGTLPVERVPAALAIARSWLPAGGRLVVIDGLDAIGAGAGRRAGGSKEAAVPGFAAATDVGVALVAAGFVDVDVSSTGRFLVLATALAPG